VILFRTPRRGRAGGGRPDRGALARLDDPLRFAVAGKVKAGKSTLLNATVAEELAADRCTKVLTW
jgi:predicted GTPase